MFSNEYAIENIQGLFACLNLIYFLLQSSPTSSNNENPAFSVEKNTFYVPYFFRVSEMRIPRWK